MLGRIGAYIVKVDEPVWRKLMNAWLFVRSEVAQSHLPGDAMKWKETMQ
jgi:hypothetical protein